MLYGYVYISYIPWFTETCLKTFDNGTVATLSVSNMSFYGTPCSQSLKRVCLIMFNIFCAKNGFRKLNNHLTKKVSLMTFGKYLCWKMQDV